MMDRNRLVSSDDCGNINGEMRGGYTQGGGRYSTPCWQEMAGHGCSLYGMSHILSSMHSSGMLVVYIYPRDRTGHIHNPLLHCAVFYGVPDVANIMKMVLF